MVSSKKQTHSWHRLARGEEEDEESADEESAIERRGGCVCAGRVPVHYRGEVKVDPRIKVILALLLFIYPPLLAFVDSGILKALQQEAAQTKMNDVETWPKFYCDEWFSDALTDLEDNCFLDDEKCKLRCHERHDCVVAFRTWLSIFNTNQCRNNWVCVMLPKCTKVWSDNPNDRVFVDKVFVEKAPVQQHKPEDFAYWAEQVKQWATSESWIKYFVPMLHVALTLLVVCTSFCLGMCLVAETLLVCVPTFVVLASQDVDVQAAFRMQCWVQLLGLVGIGIMYMEVKLKEHDVLQRIDKLPLRQFVIEQNLLDYVSCQGINLNASATREGMAGILGGLALTGVICLVMYVAYKQLTENTQQGGSWASYGWELHNFFTQALLGCDPMTIAAFVLVCLLFYVLSGFLQLAMTHICRGARICATIAPADELRMYAYKTAAEAFAAEQKALVYVTALERNPDAIEGWVDNHEPTVMMLKQLVVKRGSHLGIQKFVEVHTDQRAKEVLELKIKGEFNPRLEDQWSAVDQDAEGVNAAFQETLARGRDVASGVARVLRGAVGSAARLGARAAGMPNR